MYVTYSVPAQVFTNQEIHLIAHGNYNIAKVTKDLWHATSCIGTES